MDGFGVSKFDNYGTLCIWQDGPGRPYDNVYFLDRIVFVNSCLSLFFRDGEACTIYYPHSASCSRCRFTILSAEKIIWEFYYYGKPQSMETKTYIHYLLRGDSICIDERGCFNRHYTVSTRDRFAFDFRIQNATAEVKKQLLDLVAEIPR